MNTDKLTEHTHKHTSIRTRHDSPAAQRKASKPARRGIDLPLRSSGRLSPEQLFREVVAVVG
jgi:hypothetical protein